MTTTIDVHAAGGLLRREAGPDPEFCVVHRPRYDDWTIPKGKLEPGESHVEAAVREIEEETGFLASVGPPLPSTRYADLQGRSKVVRYWLMTPVSGEFRANEEVDEVRWLRSGEAIALLTHDHDRAVIAAGLALDLPLFLVRHAKAGSRSNWEEDDRLRPLSRRGREQAESIGIALAAEGVTRILSSPYLRCVQTVRPLSLRTGLSIEDREALSEGGEAESVWALAAALGGPAAICSHGDLIPSLIELAARDGAELPPTSGCRKGSLWRLERRAGRVVAATYVEPSP